MQLTSDGMLVDSGGPRVANDGTRREVVLTQIAFVTLRDFCPGAYTRHRSASVCVAGVTGHIKN
jgi:hypothetical protein